MHVHIFFFSKLPLLAVTVEGGFYCFLLLETEALSHHFKIFLNFLIVLFSAQTIYC